MKKTFKRISALLATAIMAVSCGTITTSASEAGASATLTNATGVAGSLVTVNLVFDTDDMCNGYNFDIKFDNRLELKNIEGAIASEVNGNVASIINFTGMYFKDGKAISTLTFMLPSDAAEGETFSVEFSGVNDFKFDGGNFINPVMRDSKIEVLEGLSSTNSVTNNIVYIYMVDGMTVSETALRGDVNGDGVVDLKDTIAAAQSMFSKKNSSAKSEFFADVNQDGKVDLMDIIALARHNMAKDKTNAWGKIINK